MAKILRDWDLLSIDDVGRSIGLIMGWSKRTMRISNYVFLELRIEFHLTSQESRYGGIILYC
jgi:hypothetical protein